MKKTTIYIFATLIAALMVFSCVQPLEPGIRTENAGKHQLKLTASCQSPRTKAYADTTAAGENRWNENKISHIDWFIFRDTAANSKPWDFGREPINKADGTSEFNVTSVEMDDYMTDYPDGEGYVLTVANYPSTDEENVFNNLTFSEIRKMGFITQELEALQDGRFTPLNDFVMTSYATHFKLEEEGTPVTVNAELSRLAAKITLNVSIVPYIDEVKAYISGIDTTGIEYVQTWYPDVSGIRAYLTFANDSTTLTPVDTSKRVAQEYNDRTFFTYNSRGFIPEIETNSSTGVSTVTGSPFYSYPMQWKTSDAHAPFIKIILKWEGRYLPNTTNPNGNFGRYINHNTGGTRLGDTVVINSYNKEDGWVKTNSQNFYYKISLPSDHNILYSNVWTKINLDVAVLGGVDEEQTVDVIGRYYVVDWSNPGVAGGGNLEAGKYLSLATARDTFYMYGVNSIEIPVKSSHALAATIVTREAYVGGAWTQDPQKPNGTTINIANRGSVSIADDGRSSITLSNQLNTDFTSANLDCYPLRFTIDLTHASGSGGLTTTERIYVVQYPSIYIDQITGGDTFVNGFFGHLNVNGAGTYYYRGTTQSTGGNATTTGYGTSGNGGNVRVSYGNMTRLTSDEQNMIVVSISSFGENSNTYTVSGTGGGTYPYVIADPRTDVISSSVFWDYNTNYTGTGANTTSAWPSTNIKVGSMETRSPNVAPGRNYIAPKFMISSTWGRNPGMGNDGITFEMAQRRCATYQEAGYPAGRWRLPTEAEAAFITVLQHNNFISTMFNNSTAYALSNATGITVSGSSGSIGNSIRSLRCVYDLWFWGDEPFTNKPWTYVIAPGNTQLN